MSKEALQNFEKTRERIFNENQSKLPPEDRVGQKSLCTTRHDGYACTKEAGHAGRHVAHGALGDICKAWEA